MKNSIFAKPNGMWKEMLSANRIRLQEDFFKAQEIYLDKNNEWSGDWQGRDLLAQLCHTIFSGEPTDELQPLFDGFEEHLNEEGYFGEIIDPNALNEQQWAGNGWVLRALCLWREIEEERPQRLIEKMVRGLFLPYSDVIDRYPKSRAHIEEGSHAGVLLAGSDRGFRFSTDIGCIYIALDGLCHAYEYFPDAELKRMIRKMTEHFFATDVEACRFQTHATLTALRGIIKFSEITGDNRYMGEVVRRFELYTKRGMSLSFANYNWFGRPEFTEPCAIIDSFMVARRLYRITGEQKYLALTYRILYNALVFSERGNGGMGCDSCVNEQTPALLCMEDAYEAYWCCTMRGGEGLCDCMQIAGDDKHLVLELLFDCEIEAGGGSVRVQTQFPYKNEVTVTATGTAPGFGITVCLPIRAKVLSVKGAVVQEEAGRLVLTQIDAELSLHLAFMPELKQKEVAGGYIYDYGVLRLCRTEGAPKSDFKMATDVGVLYSVPRMLRCPGKEEGLKARVYFVHQKQI